MTKITLKLVGQQTPKAQPRTTPAYMVGAGTWKLGDRAIVLTGEGAHPCTLTGSLGVPGGWAVRLDGALRDGRSTLRVYAGDLHHLDSAAWQKFMKRTLQHVALDPVREARTEAAETWWGDLSDVDKGVMHRWYREGRAARTQQQGAQ